MKYRDFKKEVEDWGRKHNHNPVVKVGCEYIEIALEGNGYVSRICYIHKLERFIMDLIWPTCRDFPENTRGDLFKIVSEFAKTPIEKREYKKYKFRHKYLGGRNSNYLTYDTVGGNWILRHDIKTYDSKCEFTIDELKEKFNSNLDDWEIIEVEE